MLCFFHPVKVVAFILIFGTAQTALCTGNWTLIRRTAPWNLTIGDALPKNASEILSNLVALDKHRFAFIGRQDRNFVLVSGTVADQQCRPLEGLPKRDSFMLRAMQDNLLSISTWHELAIVRERDAKVLSTFETSKTLRGLGTLSNGNTYVNHDEGILAFTPEGNQIGAIDSQGPNTFLYGLRQASGESVFSIGSFESAFGTLRPERLVWNRIVNHPKNFYRQQDLHTSLENLGESVVVHWRERRGLGGDQDRDHLRFYSVDGTIQRDVELSRRVNSVTPFRGRLLLFSEDAGNTRIEEGAINTTGGWEVVRTARVSGSVHFVRSVSEEAILISTTTSIPRQPRSLVTGGCTYLFDRHLRQVVELENRARANWSEGWFINEMVPLDATNQSWLILQRNLTVLSDPQLRILTLQSR